MEFEEIVSSPNNEITITTKNNNEILKECSLSPIAIVLANETVILDVFDEEENFSKLKEDEKELELLGTTNIDFKKARNQKNNLINTATTTTTNTTTTTSNIGEENVLISSPHTRGLRILKFNNQPQTLGFKLLDKATNQQQQQQAPNLTGAKDSISTTTTQRSSILESASSISSASNTIQQQIFSNSQKIVDEGLTDVGLITNSSNSANSTSSMSKTTTTTTNSSNKKHTMESLQEKIKILNEKRKELNESMVPAGGSFSSLANNNNSNVSFNGKVDLNNVKMQLKAKKLNSVDEEEEDFIEEVPMEEEVGHGLFDKSSDILAEKLDVDENKNVQNEKCNEDVSLSLSSPMDLDESVLSVCTSVHSPFGRAANDDSFFSTKSEFHDEEYTTGMEEEKDSINEEKEEEEDEEQAPKEEEESLFVEDSLIEEKELSVVLLDYDASRTPVPTKPVYINPSEFAKEGVIKNINNTVKSFIPVQKIANPVPKPKIVVNALQLAEQRRIKAELEKQQKIKDKEQFKITLKARQQQTLEEKNKKTLPTKNPLGGGIKSLFAKPTAVPAVVACGGGGEKKKVVASSFVKPKKIVVGNYSDKAGGGEVLQITNPVALKSIIKSKVLEFAKPLPITPLNKAGPSDHTQSKQAVPIKNAILRDKFIAVQKEGLFIVNEETNANIVDKHGDLIDIDSDDESGDEEDGKEIPLWAIGENLRLQLEIQEKIDPDTLFNDVRTCDLEDIFPNKKMKKRTSSASWSGVDELTAAENKRYKESMGWA